MRGEPLKLKRRVLMCSQICVLSSRRLLPRRSRPGPISSVIGDGSGLVDLAAAAAGSFEIAQRGAEILEVIREQAAIAQVRDGSRVDGQQRSATNRACGNDRIRTYSRFRFTSIRTTISCAGRRRKQVAIGTPFRRRRAAAAFPAVNLRQSAPPWKGSTMTKSPL